MYSSKIKNITSVGDIPAELKDNQILINSTNETIDLSDGQAICQGEWSQDLDTMLFGEESVLSSDIQMSILGVYKVIDSRFFGENYIPIFVEYGDYTFGYSLSLGFRVSGFKQIISDKLDQIFEMIVGGEFTQQELNEIKTDILTCVCDTPFGFCPLNPTYDEDGSGDYWNERDLSEYFTDFFHDKDIAVVNNYIPYEIVACNGMECLEVLLKYDSDSGSEKTNFFKSLLDYLLQCINLICIYYNNVCYCIFYECNQMNLQLPK